MDIQSRSAAGLPPVPSSIGHRSLSSWAGIKVHHTGGAFSSWRAIHDWQTAGRDEDDQLDYIGYSFGIANGRVTELRGWDHHPAHDHQNSTLGVVFGGSYVSKLPPAEDLAAFVDFVRFARQKTGRPLPVTGHRDTWPAGDWRHSTCPGDRLYAHLPQLRQQIDQDQEDDMTRDEVQKACEDAIAGLLIQMVEGNTKRGRHTRRRLRQVVTWPTNRLIKAQQPLLEAAAQGQPLTADQVAAVAAAVSDAVGEDLAEDLAEDVVDELGERIGGGDG